MGISRKIQKKIKKLKRKDPVYTEKQLSRLKAKAEKGDLKSALKLSDCFFAQKEEEWETWGRMAAETGDAEAIYFYAERISDEEKRFELYSGLASGAKKDEERSIGEYGLARCYEKGEPVKKNVRSAFDWYLRSAIHGNVMGQLKVAYFYKRGRVVKQDDGNAFYWFLKAARQKNAEAAFEVGLCYEKGRGVEADPEKAARYYGQAEDRGDSRGEKRRHLLFPIPDYSKVHQSIRKTAVQTGKIFYIVWALVLAVCLLGFLLVPVKKVKLLFIQIGVAVLPLPVLLFIFLDKSSHRNRHRYLRNEDPLINNELWRLTIDSINKVFEVRHDKKP